LDNSHSGRFDYHPERLLPKNQFIAVGIVPSTEQSALIRGIRVQVFGRFAVPLFQRPVGRMTCGVVNREYRRQFIEPTNSRPQNTQTTRNNAENIRC
jgi:hypothetical protein